MAGMARLSLAEQIALLEDPAPIDIDPEDTFRQTENVAADDVAGYAQMEEGAEEQRSHYVDVGRSTLRGPDPALSAPKYVGVRASRVKIFDDDSEFSDEEEFQLHAEVDEDDDVDDDEEGNDDGELAQTKINGFHDEPIEDVPAPFYNRTPTPAPLNFNLQSDDEGEDEGEDDEQQHVIDDDNDDEGNFAGFPGSDGEEVLVARPEESQSEDEGLVSAAEEDREEDDPKSEKEDKQSIKAHSAEKDNEPPEPAPNSERLKGLAVRRQLATYDTLLSTRIALQKSLTLSNLFPLPGQIGEYTTHPAVLDSVRAFEREAVRMGEELFELREGLLKLNEKMELPQRPAKRKRAVSDENDENDDNEEDEEDFDFLIASATSHHMALSAAAHPTTLSTLSKWSSKILAVQPTFLSSTTSSHSSKFSRPTQPKSIVQVIDDALSEGGEKLVGRTRGRRGDRRIGRRVEEEGDGEEEAGDGETFDDADFYGALLRDVIESKRGGVTLDELLPNRKKKLKKKVDTKASKGRKLRFETHEKLQHFMPPVPPRGAWGEAQVDELFASLLGRGNAAPAEEIVNVNGSGTANGVNGHVAVEQLRVFG